MDFKNVLDYQGKLIQEHKYRALPDGLRKQARAFYADNLPEGFCLDGAQVPLFSKSGLKIANGYSRIVIGDYGAMVQIKPEDIVHENICVKKGQEYRDNDPKYSGRVKFSWLTTKDDADVKIVFQKKEVGYADFVRGMYYVSPYECLPPKVEVLDKGDTVAQEDIAEWLKGQGVFSKDMVEYYVNVGCAYGCSLKYAVAHDMPPCEFEFWFRLNEICSECGELSYEQFATVVYNLELIDFKVSELNGKLDALASPVKAAIQLGLEALAIPYELQVLQPEGLRGILSLSVDNLLIVSHFSKVLCGHKAEVVERAQFHDDVGALVANAQARVSKCISVSKEREFEMA